MNILDYVPENHVDANVFKELYRMIAYYKKRNPEASAFGFATTAQAWLDACENNGVPAGEIVGADIGLDVAMDFFDRIQATDMAELKRRIEDGTLELDERAQWLRDCGSFDTAKAAGICQYLGHNGEHVFPLSCRVLGGLLGIDYKHANRVLHRLLKMNVIKVNKPGTKAKAARYRYIRKDKTNE